MSGSQKVNWRFGGFVPKMGRPTTKLYAILWTDDRPSAYDIRILPPSATAAEIFYVKQNSLHATYRTFRKGAWLFDVITQQGVARCTTAENLVKKSSPYLQTVPRYSTLNTNIEKVRTPIARKVCSQKFPKFARRRGLPPSMKFEDYVKFGVHGGAQRIKIPRGDKSSSLAADVIEIIDVE